MKKVLAVLLSLALFGGAALAETDAQTRQRDITVDGVTETIEETLFTAPSGYSIWLQDGWQLQFGMEGAMAPENIPKGGMPEGVPEGDVPEGIPEGGMPEGIPEGDVPEGVPEGGDIADMEMGFIADVYAPLDAQDASLTVQPTADLTSEDADSFLGEATYTEDAEAVVSEISSFAMEDGSEARTVEVISGGVAYRYYFIAGDGLSLCVTAQFPEGDAEGYGARMEEMIASIAFENAM